MSQKDFKFTSNFESRATLNFGKWKEALASESLAQYGSDLSDLRKLLPSDSEIEENPDLLYTSFNAAVVNLINLNDQGMATDTALAVSKYFVNRHMNLNHDRYEVVGHIISQGYSTYGDNKIVTAEDLAGTKDPFNISLGAVLYRIVQQYMIEYIEDTSKQGPYHHEVSASWEVGYNEYDIVIGSKKVADAEIISDPKQVQEMTQYLKMAGGSGFLKDGTPAYCLIKGNARPLGCAFTSKPAAAVKGLMVASTETEAPAKAEAAASEPSQDVIEIKALKNLIEDLSSKMSEMEKNNSQPKQTTVTKNSMKIKSIEEITPEFLHEAEASTALKTFIAEKLSESSQAHLEQLKLEKDAKDSIQKDLTDTASTLAQIQTTLAEAKAEAEKLKLELASRDKQEKLSARMEEITAQYELSADQKKVVVAQVSDLDEEAYASWQTSFQLFAVKKAEQSTASQEEKQIESLKTATASQSTIPNITAGDEDSLSKFVQLLSESITTNA